LPDVPPATHEEKEVLIYRSTFLGTVIEITVTASEIVIKSDNISAITIVKD